MKRVGFVKVSFFVFVALFLLIIYSCNEEETPSGNYIKGTGQVTDIDGNVYNTVIIGNNILDLGMQEWMSENLRAAHYSNGDIITDATAVMEWLEFYTGAWSWPNNDSQNEETYGRLYNWFAAADSRNVCPTGWRVPTDDDWTTLITLLDIDADPEGLSDQSSTAGGLMKEEGTAHWNTPNVDATNKSGFSARGAGARGGDYHWFGEGAYWWSQTEEYNEDEEDEIEYAWYRFIQNSGGAIHRGSHPSFKQFGFSVRCVKNADDYVGLPTFSTSPVIDITSTTATSGGNITSDGGAEVTARGVVWSTSQSPTLLNNLGFTADGSGVGEFTSSISGLIARTTYYVRAYATNSAGTGYGESLSFATLYFVYGDDVDDVDGNTYKTVIIGSQTWMAENLKTTKYNDASSIDFGTENAFWEDYTSGTYTWYDNNIENGETYGALYSWHAVNTGKLCPASWHVPTNTEWFTLVEFIGGQVGTALKATSGWDNNGNGTDEYGFKALPGGSRNYSYHSFFSKGTSAYWWSSTLVGANTAWVLFVSSGSSSVTTNDQNVNNGFSVRCVKN